MVTLILADDHPAFAAGLRAVFDAEADFEVLAVVGTGRAAVDAAIAYRPEVAVLDIAMYLFVNALTTVSAVVFLYSPQTALASIAVLNMDDAGDVAPAAAMA